MPVMSILLFDRHRFAFPRNGRRHYMPRRNDEIDDLFARKEGRRRRGLPFSICF